MRVALVTEELVGLGKTGGIGAAFEELALILGRAGFETDIVFAPIEKLSDDEYQAATSVWSRHGVKLLCPDLGEFIWNRYNYAARSYALFRFLSKQEPRYDVIHFHDYKGLGFYSLSAKRQRLAFEHSSIVVQVHGPTRWALEANKQQFTHRDQLQIDFLERRSIEMADWLVAPSQYILSWLQTNGISTPAPERTRVIRNGYGQGLVSIPRNLKSSQSHDRLTEIVYFGRQERRKGFLEFCDAISLVEPLLKENGIAVSFIGQLSMIDNVPSVVHLAEKARKWDIPINLYTTFDRYQALQYMVRRNCIIAIPSPVENLPYTVCEAACLEKPVITSSAGGAREWLSPHLHEHLLFEPNAKSLAQKLRSAIGAGLPRAELAEGASEIAEKWVSFHKTVVTDRSEGPALGADLEPLPKVVLGITHFERPEKLLFSLLSAARQTYRNLQIVVYDDGSPSSETQARLDDLAPLMERLGATLIRGRNVYLGAARNAIAAATSSDYLVFLDDDDIALPEMVETLVTAAISTKADVVGCPHLYLHLSNRPQYEGHPEQLREKLAYTPMGGPLSLATLENCLCAATALIRRSHFEKLGGYSELFGVGYEDYEFFLRTIQDGGTLEIVPIPLYLYEVGRPSMANQTSQPANHMRVLHATDYSRNADAWRDLANLSAGLKIQEDLVNRRLWIISESPEKECLTRLQDASKLSTPEYLLAAAEYADSVGAGSLALALRRANTDGPEVSPAKVRRPQKPALAPLMKDASLYKDEYWQLVLDCALGRRQSALMRLTSLLERSAFIDSDLLTLAQRLIVTLRRLAGTGDAPASATEDSALGRRLIASLSRVDYRPEDADAMCRLCIETSCLAGDAAILASVIKSSLEADQLDYLTIHADVAEAAGESVDYALEHYQRHGHSEGRRGFSRTTIVCRLLEECGPARWHPWSLAVETPDLLLKLLQGRPVTPSVFDIAVNAIAESAP